MVVEEEKTGDKKENGKERYTRRTERERWNIPEACLSTGDVLCENKERRNKGRGRDGGLARRRQNVSGWKGGWRKMEGEE